MSIRPRASVKPSVVLLEEAPAELRLYGWKDITILIWDAEPTPVTAKLLNDALGLRKAASPQASVVMVVTPRASLLPSPKAREELLGGHHTRELTTAALAVVVEHEGFVAGAIRAAITSVLLLSARRGAVQMTSSLAQVSTWLPDAHARATGVRHDPAELLAALEHARYARRSPASIVER